MGTWGPGPFDNDAASDFLEQLHASPSRVVAKALRDVAKRPAGNYIDVDDGGAAWAACELVALAFGYGDADAAGDAVLDMAARLTPKQEQRRLALEVLTRIADRTTSELAGLWHEGSDGAGFDASIAHLRTRLEAASSGARESPKAKKGDVIALGAASSSGDMIVVQVVAPREVAVMMGTFVDDATALATVKHGPAQRLPAPVNELLRKGRVLGNVPVRKDLRGKKLYAGEIGAITGYILATASAGGARVVSYEEACDRELLRPYGEDAIRAIALGKKAIQRVRSPDEREAQLTARNATKWASRRDVTDPGPFGDVEIVEGLLKWIEDYGVENAIRGFHDEARGVIGYGRPNEYPERRSYAFVGLVAIWCKVRSCDDWPSALHGRLPETPEKGLLDRAVEAARMLVEEVVTREAELRMIWEAGPDRGAGLHAAVAALKSELS